MGSFLGFTVWYFVIVGPNGLDSLGPYPTKQSCLKAERNYDQFLSYKIDQPCFQIEDDGEEEWYYDNATV